MALDGCHGLLSSKAEVEVAPSVANLWEGLYLDTAVLKLLQLFEPLWKQKSPLQVWWLQVTERRSFV